MSDNFVTFIIIDVCEIFYINFACSQFEWIPFFTTKKCSRPFSPVNFFSTSVLHSTNRMELCKKCFLTGEDSTVAYRELIEKIELFNKVLCLILCSGGAFCTVTPLPYSFVRYYIFDKGEESFFLFYPSWFVILLTN